MVKIFCEVKDKLNTTTQFLIDCDILTVARMKDIHFLFNTTSKVYFCHL